MKYEKINNMIIKALIKEDYDFRFCEEYEGLQPVLLNSWSIIFTPKHLFFIDKNIKWRNSAFNVAAMKITRDVPAEYKGIDKGGGYIFTDGQKEFLFDKFFNQFLDPKSEHTFYFDENRYFLLIYDKYDRPAIFQLVIKNNT